jgi:hypothetical protein
MSYVAPMALTGFVLLVGFALSIRNFYRHGRSARIALVGYLLLLMWYWTNTFFLSGVTFMPGATGFWRVAIGILHSAGYVLQLLAAPLGYALLVCAVFAGRKSPADPIPPRFDGGAE